MVPRPAFVGGMEKIMLRARGRLYLVLCQSGPEDMGGDTPSHAQPCRKAGQEEDGTEE